MTDLDRSGVVHRGAVVGLAVWSVGYALPHLYWALGGHAGFSLLKPSATELDEWELINAVATVVLLMPAALGFALVRYRGHARAMRVLLFATWAGASIAASHGLYGMAYRVANLAGVTQIDGRDFALSRHGWVIWDLVLFEPWFLCEGLLLTAAGGSALSTAGGRRRWLIACAAGTSVATITGVVGLRFA